MIKQRELSRSGLPIELILLIEFIHGLRSGISQSILPLDFSLSVEFAVSALTGLNLQTCEQSEDDDVSQL